MTLKLIKDEQEARREQFLQENYLKWNEEGAALRERRLKLGFSLRDVGKLLGTSASRIRKLEVGEPVSQAKHLKASCNLLFDHVELHGDLFDLRSKHPWKGLYRNE